MRAAPKFALSLMLLVWECPWECRAYHWPFADRFANGTLDMPLDIDCNTAGLPRTPGEVKAQTFGPLTSYNAHDRPSLATRFNSGYIAGGVQPQAPAEQISVAMTLLTLVELDAPGQTFTVDVVLRMIWMDERLQFNASCFQPDTFDSANYDIAEQANLWTPNLFPDNLISMTINTAHSGIWVRSDGRVWWARQMRWVLGCSMDFTNMPFDTQVCQARLSDFLYDASAVRPIVPDGTEFVAGFDAIIQPSCNERGGTIEWVVSGLTGEYPVGTVSEAVVDTPVLDLVFTMTRHPGYWISNLVVPMVIVVILSWFSFFISRTAPPARVAVPIIAFLSISNLTNSVLRSLPRLEGSVWLLDLLFISAVFVFISAFEYALVAILFRAEARITKVLASEPPPTKKEDVEVTIAEEVIESRKIASMGRMDRLLVRAGGKGHKAAMWIQDQHLDIFCRWTYLCTYLIVVIVYFQRVARVAAPTPWHAC